MVRVHVLKWKPLLISLIISLGVGALAGFLTMANVDLYKNLELPPLSPPAAVFPIVWTVLYLLMGISAYMIYTSNAEGRSTALKIYAAQLIVNFFWSLLFFNSEDYLFSFLWLSLLWILIILMIVSFYRVNKCAAYLQIPYLLWVTFAGYLNLGIYSLNR